MHRLLLLPLLLVGAQRGVDELVFPDPGTAADCYGQLSKVSLNQSAYVQYSELVTSVPAMTSFTACAWIKVHDSSRFATMLNYALDEVANIDNLTITYTTGGSWIAVVNGKRLYNALTRPLENDVWTHLCHSWDAKKDGKWSVWQNGGIADQGVNHESQQWVIPAGGVLVTGQHQGTILSGGMDQGAGLVGEITLLQMWKTAVLEPSADLAHQLVKRLSADCVAADRGDLIGWLSTPRRGYGGATTSVARQVCSQF